MKYILKPIDSRTKRLINDFGSEWETFGKIRPMFCFNGNLGITLNALSDKNKFSNFRLEDFQKFEQKGV